MQLARAFNTPHDVKAVYSVDEGLSPIDAQRSSLDCKKGLSDSDDDVDG
jgi:hypothetical protein